MTSLASLARSWEAPAPLTIGTPGNVRRGGTSSVFEGTDLIVFVTLRATTPVRIALR